MKIIKKLIMLITLLCVGLFVSGCSVLTPYLDKAAELSVEASTKTLETSVYYLCDRSRSGDLIRRYPNTKELKRHFEWCLAQQKIKQSIAPRGIGND